MTEIRYDVVPIRADIDESGHIHDTPILTRVGVFPYRDPKQPNGIRYEFRPHDEVFSPAHMKSLLGKPITAGHPRGLAHSRRDADPTLGPDGKPWRAIGAALSEARQDGDYLVGDIVIHHPEAVHGGAKELSLGYKLDLIEEAGEWNGQPYGFIQKNLRIDHVAVVPKGRAGVSRLNLDAADVEITTPAVSPSFPKEPPSMSDQLVDVRLDESGLIYKAAPEISVAIRKMHAELDKMRADAADAKVEIKSVSVRADEAIAAAKASAAADVATANTRADEAIKARDVAQGEADMLKSQMDKVRADAAAEGRAAAIARLHLEGQAKEVGYVFNADASDSEIRIGMLAKLAPEIRLDGKSDEYVNAAFDIALAGHKDRGANAGAQRATVVQMPVRQDAAIVESSAAAARRRMLSNKGA